MDTVVKSMLDEDPEDEKKVMNNIIIESLKIYFKNIFTFIILTQNTFSLLLWKTFSILCKLLILENYKHTQFVLCEMN